MFALLLSAVATVILTAMVIMYGQRRPADAVMSWGEAMGFAGFVFLLLFVIYGILPHQWLTLADNEWGWRSDKLLYGPFDILKPESQGGANPVTITYLTLRDIVATLIYVVALGGQIAGWVWWQNRGKTVSVAVESSEFGRPLKKA